MISHPLDSSWIEKKLISKGICLENEDGKKKHISMLISLWNTFVWKVFPDMKIGLIKIMGEGVSMENFSVVQGDSCMSYFFILIYSFIGV